MAAHQDFVLTFWNDEMLQQEVRSAFQRKMQWVIPAADSRALWYWSVLSNLNGRYSIPEDATISAVREALTQGLKKSAFDRLKAVTDLSGEELAQVVRVPTRTLARREKFKPDESERILRIASAFQRTLDVFEDVDKARRWFSSPSRALGNETPLKFCDTEPGAEEVMHLLGRIEHGVFT
ncbi:MAG: DUF2384 domain-containing protein [Planctomycetales bacterium]|nr:DUF2384 domain-containing protein [Planctomycetales bacterium]